MGRDDEVGQLPANDLLPAVAEGAFGSRVELDDIALVVDGDDAVESRFQDGGLADFALAQAGVLAGQQALELAALYLPKLFRLAFDLLGFLEELDKTGYLRPQDHGHQGLYQEVHRSQGVGLLGAELVAFVGRQENDWGVPGALAAADPLGRLEAVQAVHLHVEQDHGEVVALAPTKSFCAGMGFHQVVAEVVKNRIEGKKVGRLIIDQQDVHRLLGRQFFRQVERVRGIRHIPS